MPSRTKRWLWVGVGVVVVGGAAGYATSRITHSHVASAKSAILSAYLVERSDQGSFEGSVSTSGTVAPLAEATVQSSQAGEIAQVKVSLGQKVTQGDVVATLSGGQTVTSPITGTVVDLNTAAGSYVSAGQTLLTVANMKSVYADVTVSEDDVRNVAVGQSVSLTVPALPNKTYTGTITAVGALGTGSSSVTYPVTIDISKPSGILLGMSVNATIDTGTVSDAVYVPTSAIQTVDGQAEVLVPEKNLATPSFSFGGGGFGGFGGSSSSSTTRPTARKETTIPVARKVVLGLTNGTDTQIKSGLGGDKQILVPNPTSDTSTSSTTPGFGGFGGLGGFGGHEGGDFGGFGG